MGEEAKQEEPKAAAAPAEVKAEEKKEQKAEEKTQQKTEEKPEEAKPPPPFVLFVDLHCVGCAKKIEKSIMKIRGVEGVTIDMAQNQVTIKGVVEPQAVCNRIMNKTKRRAQVLSPLPATEGEPMPEVVASQVSGFSTVELNVDMHCQACAEQLKRKILKMKGVQTAVTDHTTGKVTVTGTMDANKLVDYLHRRTKKKIRIVPQPEPEPESEKQEDKKEAGGGEAAPAPEEAKPAEEKKEDGAEKKKEEKPPEEAKKGEENSENNTNNNKGNNEEEEGMKKMIYYYQPLYVIEQMPPPPQLFSDENPNACSIS